MNLKKEEKRKKGKKLHFLPWNHPEVLYSILHPEDHVP